MAKPKVSVGWVLGSDERNEQILSAYEQACRHLETSLSQQFPQFQWELPFVKRRQYSPRGALEPLPLLEMGVHEKIYSAWDYALVIVPNELTPRDRIFTIGIPSSALEVAVLSTARMEENEHFCDQLVGLALHMLGHMWGLEHHNEGPMVPPETLELLCLSSFPPEQQEEIVDRLEEVADARLEEQPQRRNWLSFYWNSFWADPEGILTDIWGYAPWRLPFRMGRLTAAAAVSMILLLLGAEAWELGVSFAPATLVIAAVFSILAATIFIFFGQNLGQISRELGWREQIARTRLVLFCTVLAGDFVLWVVLFVISFLVVMIVPREVPANWLDTPLDSQAMARHAAFMATLGVLAGALGGNLEDEDELKAKLFYDEET